MSEKIYLGDWLYNAGILGFLNILNGWNTEEYWHIKDGELISEQPDKLKFYENYIEIDRSIFKGYAEKYFDYAFNMYGRYYDIKALLEKSLKEIKSSSFDIDKIESIKNRLSGFSLLKNKIGDLPSKNEIKKDTNKLIDIIQKALKTLEEDIQEFKESDTQIFLRNIYEQKSFLNLSVNKDRLKKFYKDFEEPLKTNSSKNHKTYKCVICDRQAKDNTIFDTGLSKFYGLNKDAVNFVWNFENTLPICDICEIIYFSYFAGFVKSQDKKFNFVNDSNSLMELIKTNYLFKESLKDKDNKFIKFFTELVLQYQHQKSTFSLQNIAIMEVDLSNDSMPRVYSFNLSKQKAEFLKSQDTIELLKNLSKSFYKTKDTIKYILPEILSLYLENKLGYYYLSKLLRLYMTQRDEISITPYQLQIINKILVGGLKMNVGISELNWFYHKGKELSDVIKRKDQENKIPSIAYKLLNALRIGDTNQFMDIIIRTYMAYEGEIPINFSKSIANKDVFYSLGYSFLNGLLGKENESKDKPKEV